MKLETVASYPMIMLTGSDPEMKLWELSTRARVIGGT